MKLYFKKLNLPVKKNLRRQLIRNVKQETENLDRNRNRIVGDGNGEGT